MDIKELDKKQLILLVLLITFVVSISTGIITVSLMKQMPSSVPQTINNVIQRTIEKVTTVEVPSPSSETKIVDDKNDSNQTNGVILGDSNTLVSIYLNKKKDAVSDTDPVNDEKEIEPIGQGVIISDVGLILIDSKLVNDVDTYKVILNGKDFEVSVLKKYDNGFSILKISSTTTTSEVADTSNKTQ